jgi:hypothetical protein
MLGVAVTVVTLASIAALVTLGYTGLALYSSFSSALEGMGALSVGGPASTMVNITNNGLYPASLRMTVNVTASGQSLQVLDRRLYLRPGETGSVNLSAPISLEEATISPESFGDLLVKGLNVSMVVNFVFAVDPFVKASAQAAQSSFVGPVMSNLNLRASGASFYNSTHVVIPLTYAFFNRSPLSLQGNVTVSISDQLTGGNLAGSGSGPFVTDANSLTQGTLNVYLDRSLLKQGVYFATLTVSVGGASGEVTVPFSYP